jgi:hypothetical protein
VRSGTTWSQQAYLKASNTGADDLFGVSVAISGETVVVGAEAEASNATGVNGNQSNNSVGESGAAYVFTIPPSNTPPAITSCPVNQSVNAAAGQCTASVSFNVTASGTPAPTITCNIGATTITSPYDFPVGTSNITCTATNGVAPDATCSFEVTVTDNQNPTITAPANVMVNANPGSCAATGVSLGAPTTSDNCAVTVTNNAPSSFPVGSTTVTWTVTDLGGNQATATQTVIVADNQNPTITFCPGNISTAGNLLGSCGASVSLGAATATDNCDSSVTITNNAPAVFPLGTTTVTWTATDDAGNSSTCQQTVTVTNPDPVAAITGPTTGSVYAVGTLVNFTGSFTDNAGGTHTATWMFDITPVAGTITGNTITGSHTFTAAGVYKVTLTVNDGCGGSHTTDVIGPDELTMLVVVYDPSAGWVTGGGWINSPAGACPTFCGPDPNLTGKANFGFVSKYQNGASVPTGNTEFHFKAGNLKFHSTAYEWMVIAGKKAQYKGSGKINNAGDYRFMLTAIDGQQPGGGGQDKFRIRIWDNNGGGLVYDNQMNDPDSNDPTTVLGGGQIVIHK